MTLFDEQETPTYEYKIIQGYGKEETTCQKATSSNKVVDFHWFPLNWWQETHKNRILQTAIVHGFSTSHRASWQFELNCEYNCFAMFCYPFKNRNSSQIIHKWLAHDGFRCVAYVNPGSTCQTMFNTGFAPLSSSYQTVDWTSRALATWSTRLGGSAEWCFSAWRSDATNHPAKPAANNPHSKKIDIYI